jgi:hypothetical protein
MIIFCHHLFLLRFCLQSLYILLSHCALLQLRMSLVISSLCISNITSIINELNLLRQFHYMRLNCGNIEKLTYGLLDIDASMELPNWWLSQWADDDACSSGYKRPWMFLSSLGPAIVTKRLNWWHEKDVCFWSSQSRPVAQNKQNTAQILFLEYISAREEVCNPILEQE